jgi:hypothetical protein
MSTGIVPNQALSQHAAEDEEGRSEISRDDGATTTEETPLLRSATSSRPASRGSSVSSEIYNDEEPDMDSANQKVSRSRGIAIGLSVYALIFLQGHYPPASRLCVENV